MQQITTADGFRLAVSCYGDAQQCCAAVIIAPAMGVEQHYYAAFAQWLAEKGYFVVSFDYRGMGRSRPEPFKRSLRGFDADVLLWARQDCAAVIDYAVERIGSRPLLWIGHSLGGQIFALVPNRERVAAVLTVATGSGYWRENVLQLKLRVWWLWFFLAPLAVRLFGYFPGRRLRKVGDLPAAAMRQWRRWCLHPEYLVGAEGAQVRASFEAVRTPMLSLSFTDDELMSARNVDQMHGFYRNAPQTRQRIAPRDIGETRIGHFGFFRRRYAQSLWPRAGEWLAQHSLAPHSFAQLTSSQERS